MKQMKCNFCGKTIKCSLVVANGNNYCSVQCLENWTNLEERIKGEQQVSDDKTTWEGNIKTMPLIAPVEIQKHEKIERMAWEYLLHYPDKDQHCIVKKLKDSFEIAEDFYIFAKEKEGKL